jgi:hypothetical protein
MTDLLKAADAMAEALRRARDHNVLVEMAGWWAMSMDALAAYEAAREAENQKPQEAVRYTCVLGGSAAYD